MGNGKVGTHRKSEEGRNYESKVLSASTAINQHVGNSYQSMMQLQRTIGNRAVTQLLTRTLPSLSKTSNKSQTHSNGCLCPACSPIMPKTIQRKSKSTVIQRCSICNNNNCKNGEICGNEPDIDDGPSRMAFGGLYREHSSNVLREAEERARFSHVTRNSNVDSILQNGLLTNHGGRGGASEAARSQAFQQHSQGHVHLGQDMGLTDNRPSHFYQQFYNSKGIPNTTLTVYPGPQQLVHLQDDPDDRQGQRYRTTEDVPPDQIHPIPLTVRENGTIGADYTPSQALSSVRRQLPPSHSGMTNNEITASLGSNIPNRETILAATSREQLYEISRRLRELARQGMFNSGTSEAYRQMARLILERLSSMET